MPRELSACELSRAKENGNNTQFTSLMLFNLQSKASSSRGSPFIVAFCRSCRRNLAASCCPPGLWMKGDTQACTQRQLTLHMVCRRKATMLATTIVIAPSLLRLARTQRHKTGPNHGGNSSRRHRHTSPSEMRRRTSPRRFPACISDVHIPLPLSW
jgi:hypothetical protein